MNWHFRQDFTGLTSLRKKFRPRTISICWNGALYPPWVTEKESLAFFLQDGVAVQSLVITKKCFVVRGLDVISSRWIGRSSQMTWATRSPDLSTLDLFMWGLLKDRVYHRKPQSMTSLKNIIEDEWLTNDQQFELKMPFLLWIWKMPFLHLKMYLNELYK